MLELYLCCLCNDELLFKKPLREEYSSSSLRVSRKFKMFKSNNSLNSLSSQVALQYTLDTDSSLLALLNNSKRMLAFHLLKKNRSV